MIAETKIAPRLFQWLAIDEATPPRCPELFSAPKFTKPHDPQFFLGLVGLFACDGLARAHAIGVLLRLGHAL